jgi:hypothetical protein
VSAETDKRVRSAIKNNNAVFLALTRQVQRLGKKTLAAMSAAALDGAMESDSTKHDSSRAAANWHLVVGGQTPYGSVSSGLNPSEYEDARFDIGKRGDEGKKKPDVINQKRHAYAYEGSGTATRATQGGWLYDAIGVGKSGTPGVHLYNAVTTDPKYARNALPGYAELKAEVDVAVRESGKLAAFEAAREISAAFRRGGKIT